MMTESGVTGADAATDSGSAPPDTGAPDTGIDAPNGG
jgi:hypothetical protein